MCFVHTGKVVAYMCVSFCVSVMSRDLLDKANHEDEQKCLIVPYQTVTNSNSLLTLGKTL